MIGVRYLSKIVELYESGYLSKAVVGMKRRVELKKLMLRYGFNSWHISPKEFRPYAMDIIKLINSRVSSNDIIVEIGCGLGEIIRNIHTHNLYGFDIDQTVIDAARFLDKDKKVHFQKGSFEDVAGFDIAYLITVNFTHGLDAQFLKSAYGKLCARNKVHNIIVDVVNNPSYKNTHKFSEILPENYRMVYESKKYASNRVVMIYSVLE